MINSSVKVLCVMMVVSMATVSWAGTVNLAWTKQLGTSNNDYSSSVAVDSSGNIYISGGTYGDLGSTNAGITDAFLTKYEPVEVIPLPASAWMAVPLLGVLGLVRKIRKARRYIHLNPCRAGASNRPQEYRWRASPRCPVKA